MLPKTILYDGSRETLPKPLELRAGPLTMIFESATAFLRQIRLGDHEVVRAIYGAVRDQNWGTIPPAISNLKSEIAADSFALSFYMACQQREIDFVWRGLIRGEPTGQVSYTFHGQARSAFLRNRIGLCVLHPIAECSGRSCLVIHNDGSEERGTFPTSISPHQPFYDIRTISYEVAATSASAEIQFGGEVFEMEDQRNWTDASFKTYCTPQSLPKPARVEPGATVEQSVTLSLKGGRPVVAEIQGRPPEVSISDGPVRPLPPIGYCVASHGRPLSAREIERLKLLRPSHLRVDLKLSSPDYPAVLQQAAAEATQLDTGLHLALTLSNQAEKELGALAVQLARIQPKVILWLVFHEAEQTTSEKWARLAQASLQGSYPNVPIAAGTREFFTELNRNRPAANAPFFPCYSSNPQVHNTDNLTMVENLAGQAATVETAKEFSARPVVVSPITLRIPAPPANAVQEPPADVDPCQMSLFGAGWTLGSISRLAATGNVQSLTYFETTGWRGLMETEAGSPLPEKFPSLPGSVFPVYHVLADIAEFSGKQMCPTRSTHPLLVEGLTLLDSQGRRRILIANLTSAVLQTKIKTGDCKARVSYLDETNAEEAMRKPETFRRRAERPAESISREIELKLLPFALARIDID